CLAKFAFVLLTATAMLSSASIRYSVSRFLIRFLMGVALNGCRNVGLCPAQSEERPYQNFSQNLRGCRKVSVSTCPFFASCVLTPRSGNRRASFPFGSQQQANEVLPHDLPTCHHRGFDISVGLSFLSMRFYLLVRRHPRQSSLIAVEVRHDA